MSRSVFHFLYFCCSICEFLCANTSPFSPGDEYLCIISEVRLITITFLASDTLPLTHYAHVCDSFLIFGRGGGTEIIEAFISILDNHFVSNSTVGNGGFFLLTTYRLILSRFVLQKIHVDMEKLVSFMCMTNSIGSLQKEWRLVIYVQYVEFLIFR